MVSVTGQLDAPLLDMGAVKQDFWERKTIVLPSLARLHKPKGWKKYFTKKQSPVIVLQRLNSSDWEEIQTTHADRRLEIAKSQAKVKELQDRLNNLEILSDEETKFLLYVNDLARPMLYSMLSAMSCEPKLTYEETMMVMEVLDDYDRNTLLAAINAMTSQKASAMKALHDSRTKELNEIKQKMQVQI